MAKKELVTKSSSNPAQLNVDDQMLDLLPRAETSDFDIPRLTLIQPTSKIEGSPGDVIDSATRETVARLNEKFIFCPVWWFKDFSISEVESKKFRRNEPKTAQNAHFSIFDNRVGTDADGVTVKRDERLNLFVIKAQSLDDDLPRVYRMFIKPSSFKESKKFLSEWDIQVRIAQRGGPMPFSYLWSVTPKQETTTKGKFCVYEFAKVIGEQGQQRITPEQLAKVTFWVKTLSMKKDEIVAEDNQPDEVIPF